MSLVRLRVESGLEKPSSEALTIHHHSVFALSAWGEQTPPALKRSSVRDCWQHIPPTAVIYTSRPLTMGDAILGLQMGQREESCQGVHAAYRIRRPEKEAHASQQL